MFGGFLTTGCDWCVSPAPELRGRAPAAGQRVVDAAAPSRRVELADRAPCSPSGFGSVGRAPRKRSAGDRPLRAPAVSTPAGSGSRAHQVAVLVDRATPRPQCGALIDRGGN
jgi:hypothetical protein